MLPPQRNQTSESAVFALVLGVASFFCVGPFAGVPAAILGGIAWSQVRRSNGHLRGGGMAMSGAILGAMGSIGWVVALVVLARAGAFAPSPTPAAPAFAPTAAFPAPTAPAPTPRAGEEGGQMTTTNEVVEVRAGNATIVDLPPSIRSLEKELADQQRKVRAAKEKLVLFVVQEQCRPCGSIAAVILDPKMQLALEHVRLVRVDVDEARPELRAMGIETQKIPGFFLLGPDGRAVDGINGGEWDDDTAENAAPVLGAFVRGSLVPAKRKERFVPAPGVPRPAPTML